jgi:ketosteroid isomerase-like protein
MGASRSLLDVYVERYNAGDLDAVMDLYAEDAVQTMPDGAFEGRSTIRERLARELNACPDATYTVGSFVEKGDTFADEWTFVGTHTGPVPAAGRHPATSHRQAGGDQGHGAGAGARREDRHRQPVLRQHGRPGPARSRPAGSDRVIES